MTPDHYKHGRGETIDAIKLLLNADEFRGFLIGNIVKYLGRYQYKDGVKDLQKAKQYLTWLINEETYKPEGGTEGERMTLD